MTVAGAEENRLQSHEVYGAKGACESSQDEGPPVLDRRDRQEGDSDNDARGAV